MVVLGAGILGFGVGSRRAPQGMYEESFSTRVVLHHLGRRTPAMILCRILVTEPCLCLAPSPSPLEREGMSKGTLISVSSGGVAALKATKERGPRGRAQLRGGVWEFWLCHVPLVPYRTCLQYVAVVGTYIHACAVV